MSIADRIHEAIGKYTNNDLDNALIQVMITIDGTARKEFPNMKNKNKERFINFINDNLDIISKVTFFRFKLNPNDRFNTIGNEEVTFAAFIYNIRCDILHEGFTKDIIWNEKSLKYQDEKNYIPTSVLLGLIIAVLGSSSNIGERFKNGVGAHAILEYKDKAIMIPFYQYFGKKHEIMQLIENGLGNPI